jgi:hypothetical protein
MRLLETSSLELEQFLPRQIPPYAILSHTWSTNPDEEVLFSDVGKEEAKQKRAYHQKVLPACQKALERGFDYIWIDTCCIDKSSSAELQEAINSMFKWYADSSICFVYLEDVCATGEKFESAMLKSRWFTRGWTLQELVAPDNIIFHSQDWNELGTRASLASLISTKTNIDWKILTYPQPSAIILDRSVANRMSWAALRETTRPEDLAYCLLGIFDVNMPLIYGEGEEKAFFRLQQAILESSDDQSLLAWNLNVLSPFKLNLRGPFAKHPIQFQYSSRIVPLPGVPDTYSMNSSGLRIDLKILPSKGLLVSRFGESARHPGVWGILRCHYENDFAGPIAIPLEWQPWKGKLVYARRGDDITTIDRSNLVKRDFFHNVLEEERREGPLPPQEQNIVIQRNPDQSWKPDCEKFHLENWPEDCSLIRAIPEDQWNPTSRIMDTDNYDVSRIFIFEHSPSGARFAVILGFSYRHPEDTLGIIRVLDLNPEGDSFECPSWLDKWRFCSKLRGVEPETERHAVLSWLRSWLYLDSEELVDVDWSDNDFEGQSALMSSIYMRGTLRDISATLRKGHIMGVPFFIVNVQIFRQRRQILRPPPAATPSRVGQGGW